MSFPFDPQERLIVIDAELWGPLGSGVLRLALDTGATRTLISTGILVATGYDPPFASERVQVTTGSGIEFAALVILDRLFALGQARSQFAVLGHTLPPSAGVDGLLGLDFFRGQSLTIDFRSGQVTLA